MCVRERNNVYLFVCIVAVEDQPYLALLMKVVVLYEEI